MATEFPTSKDIYFEADSKTVAVVQSYNTSYSKDNKEVDAFGEDEPVGFVAGKKQYSIKISRAYVTDSAVKDGISFYTMSNFDFVINKPDRKIVYSGCTVTGIDEDGSLNDIIAENITIKATTRREDSK
jgi:hypothetical protein